MDGKPFNGAQLCTRNMDLMIFLDKSTSDEGFKSQQKGAIHLIQAWLGEKRKYQNRGRIAVISYGGPRTYKEVHKCLFAEKRYKGETFEKKCYVKIDRNFVEGGRWKQYSGAKKAIQDAQRQKKTGVDIL